MLKAMLSTWDAKGEKYSFVNVAAHLEKDLLSVLPADINIRLYCQADTNSAESEEARLVGEETSAGLFVPSTSGKDATTLLDV